MDKLSCAKLDLRVPAWPQPYLPYLQMESYNITSPCFPQLPTGSMNHVTLFKTVANEQVLNWVIFLVEITSHCCHCSQRGVLYFIASNVYLSACLTAFPDLYRFCRLHSVLSFTYSIPAILFSTEKSTKQSGRVLMCALQGSCTTKIKAFSPSLKADFIE